MQTNFVRGLIFVISRRPDQEKSKSPFSGYFFKNHTKSNLLLVIRHNYEKNVCLIHAHPIPHTPAPPKPHTHPLGRNVLLCFKRTNILQLYYDNKEILISYILRKHHRNHKFLKILNNRFCSDLVVFLKKFERSSVYKRRGF